YPELKRSGLDFRLTKKREAGQMRYKRISRAIDHLVTGDLRLRSFPHCPDHPFIPLKLRADRSLMITQLNASLHALFIRQYCIQRAIYRYLMSPMLPDMRNRDIGELVSVKRHCLLDKLPPYATD